MENDALRGGDDPSNDEFAITVGKATRIVAMPTTVGVVAFHGEEERTLLFLEHSIGRSIFCGETFVVVFWGLCVCMLGLVDDEESILCHTGGRVIA